MLVFRSMIRFNGSYRKSVCFVFVTLLAYVLVGLNRSYIAFLFHQLEDSNSSISVNDDQKSWIASSTTMLSPIGCLISGLVMDVFGRRLFIQIVFIPFVISWFIISFASNVQMIYIGMAIQSIGGGMSFCIAAYISEISTTSRRGALLSTIEITYSIGVVISNILMYTLSWKIVAIIFTIFSTAALLLTFILPESPMWLYSKGLKEKSIKTLESLRCCERTALHSEIQDMEKACQFKPKINFKNALSACFRAWKPFALVTGLFILMQNTGYPMLVSFTIMIVDRLNLPYESSKITILYSTFGFIASFITPYTMHNFGRKTILTASALGMGICMTCAAVYEELFYNDQQKPIVWIIPVALCLYVFTCTLGVLPVSFVIGGEMFPHEVRGILNGMYGATGYLYWAVIFKFFPQYLLHFGVKVVLWTFAGFAGVVVCYGILLLPETKGISLNEVQEKYFQKNYKKKEQDV